MPGSLKEGSLRHASIIERTFSILANALASYKSLDAELNRALEINWEAGICSDVPGGREERIDLTRDTSPALCALPNARLSGEMPESAEAVESLYGSLGLFVCISIILWSWWLGWPSNNPLRIYGWWEVLRFTEIVRDMYPSWRWMLCFVDSYFQHRSSYKGYFGLVTPYEKIFLAKYPVILSGHKRALPCNFAGRYLYFQQ